MSLPKLTSERKVKLLDLPNEILTDIVGRVVIDATEDWINVRLKFDFVLPLSLLIIYCTYILCIFWSTLIQHEYCLTIFFLGQLYGIERNWN